MVVSKSIHDTLAEADRTPTPNRVRSAGTKTRTQASATPSKPDDVVDAALSYARRGWAVLPLHSICAGVCTCANGAKCKSPGKHPILNGGVHAATKDVGEVAQLWRDHPEANVGIATGRDSGLIALDIDPRNGGNETAQKLKAELGGLSRTVRAKTGGGGSHRLYRYPDIPCPTRHASAGLLGLDLQSDGAFIVAPPSVHISGTRYRWAEGEDPALKRLAHYPRLG